MAAEPTPSLETSDDAPALAALLRRWAAVRDRGALPGDSAAVAEVKDLARRFVAHRARLFDANARLQAEAPDDDDPTTVARIEANQFGIKACTNALSEMAAALGWASVPN